MRKERFLEDWEKTLLSLDALKLVEAKRMYQSYLLENDAQKKKSYQTKLIEGTLYVPFNYVKRNGLFAFTQLGYEKEDILSSFNEVWIETILKGEVLKVKNYAALFNAKFLEKVLISLMGMKMNAPEQYGLSYQKMLQLFLNYLTLGEKKVSVSMGNVTFLFEAMSKYSEDLSLSKVKNYFPLLLEAGLTEKLPANFRDKKDMEECSINKVYYEAFLKDLKMILQEKHFKHYLLNSRKLKEDQILSLLRHHEGVLKYL